jgi:hypothetical protein
VARTGEHRPPLAPRWVAWELPGHRAGIEGRVSLTIENAGSATWRSRGTEGVQIGYHWLDLLGNPIVWDGARTAFPAPVPPGTTIRLDLPVLAPRPPGTYRLAFDLVEEHRFWFAEIGCESLTLDAVVQPRIAARRLGVLVHGGPDATTEAALASQEEPVVEEDAEAMAHLVAGATVERDWSSRLLDAHEEGFAAVGGGLVIDHRRRELDPWSTGGGRNPRFGHALLLPSLVAGIEPTTHLGLPSYDGEDALFDGRIVVRLPPRSGRRRG